MQTPTPTAIRVPTPQEITSWVSSLPPRLRAYVKAPEHQVMWGIILLGAVLRLAHLDLIELRGDHVEHLQTALTLLGQEQPGGAQALSTASDALPMFHYLLGIPLLVGRDPRLVSAFVALLNVAAIGGFYSLVRRYYGVRVSVLASALFSAAPWAVIFSRRISCEAFMVPLTVLLLQGCTMALLDAEPLGWSLAAISLGVMLYTTLLPLPLIFALIVLIVVYSRRVQWSYLLFGTCLALLILVPYLYEQNLARFADLRSHMQRLLMKTDVLSARRGLRVATWLHSGQQLSTLVAPSQAAFRLTSPLFRRVAELEGALFLLALPGPVVLAIHTWGHWREEEDPAKYTIPAIFLWGTLLATGLQPGPLKPRCLAILYPWGFLAMGLVVDRGVRLCTTRRRGSLWWTSGLRLAIYTFYLLLILWNAYAVVYLYNFLPHHNTKEAYGIPYRVWRQTVDLARREAAEVGGDQVWVITQSENAPLVPVREVLSYLMPPNPKGVFLPQDERPSMLLPAGRPGVYLFTDPASRVEATVQQLKGKARGTVLLPGGDSFRLEIVEEKTVEEMVAAIQERGAWTFDGGPQLIGYDWSAQDTTLISYWTFPTPSLQRAEHQLHTCLQSKEGEKITCCSGFGLDQPYWQEGLVLKQWCTFPLSENPPPGEYELLMEMEQSHASSEVTEPRYIQPYQARLGTVSTAK
ncbi:MAG: glycosyltransferase family 39 protein [Chloroflexota bacterium]|nr:glycosyltransferase family 39 protein [Chloroflexota bacterium]